MDMFKTFEEYLTQSGAEIPTIWFIFNLIFTGILSFILRWFYINFGESLSNRIQFGKNIIIISMTTMLIITVVKSSLALSLGLVGALSIIRFRTAIKEPEELAYLFLAISIGLGFGANQGNITVIALIVILSMILITKKFIDTKIDEKIFNLLVRGNNTKNISLQKIVNVLEEYCSSVILRRLDENEDYIEIAFIADFPDYEKLSSVKNNLKKLDESITITYIEN